MGKSITTRCPNCFSEIVVKNGHHYGGKLQFLCRSCNKHFTSDSAKGYPPTKIPFPIIAYLLYFRRRVPGFSDMRKYRRFVNYWLGIYAIDIYVGRCQQHNSLIIQYWGPCNIADKSCTSNLIK